MYRISFGIIFLLFFCFIGCKKDAQAYKKRGYSKFSTGDISGAIRDYSEAILIKPYEAEAYSSRGYLKLNLADYTGAIQDFNKVIEIGLGRADVTYFLRGYAKLNLGDYTGAILDFNKEEEKNRKFCNECHCFDECLYRGIAKISLGDNTGAIKDFNEVIERDVDRPAKPFFSEKFNINAKAYFYRGLANFRLGNKKEALLDLSKAGELGYTEAYEKIKLIQGQ